MAPVNCVIPSFGELPFLFDVLYHLPATKDFHVLERLAKKLLATRKCAKTSEPDICSFLVGVIPVVAGSQERRLTYLQAPVRKLHQETDRCRTGP